MTTENKEPARQKQIKRLYAVLYSLGIDPKTFQKNQGFKSFAKLTSKQVSDWITDLENQEAAEKSKEGTPPLVPPERARLKEIMAECAEDAEELLATFAIPSRLSSDTRATIRQRTAIALFKARVKEEKR